MASEPKKGIPVRPTRSEEKWELTNSVSRSMMEAERKARDNKTEHLRQLRLEADTDGEAPEGEKPAGKKAAAKKPAAKRRRTTARR